MAQLLLHSPALLLQSLPDHTIIQPPQGPQSPSTLASCLAALPQASLPLPGTYLPIT